MKTLDDDSSQINCIIGDIKKGERIKNYLKEIGLYNGSYKIETDNNKIIIPIIENLTDSEKEKLSNIDPNFQEAFYSLKKRTKDPQNYREYLIGKLDESKFPLLPKSFDTIGHIAIVEIPEEIQDIKYLIGSAITATYKNIETVYCKSSAVKGVHRVRDLHFIGGNDKSEVLYKENNSKFMLDIKTTYFSPRLSNERLRVAQLTQENEFIIDMFAGVGPFSIQIAKNKKVQIIAFDINPDAIKYFKKNIEINKITSIEPILGDAKDFIELYAHRADRIIMNLPGSALLYIDAACKFLKTSGGIIHYYQFIDKANDEKQIYEILSAEIEKCQRKLDSMLFYKVIKEISPTRSQIAADLRII